jgi:lipid A ethanolaminephosphotransferase
MNSSRSLTETRFGAAFYAWLRDRWTAGLALHSDVVLILAVSTAWAVLYNLQFWHLSVAAMWHPAPGAALFLTSLFVVIVCVQALLLALVPTRVGLRIAASALFLVAAASSFFSNDYGAVMNTEMMRNLLETDRAEVGGLMSFDLVAHLLVLGVLPAILVWRVTLPPITWRAQLKQRLIFIVAALVVCAVAVFACSANYAVFFRAHKTIRYALSPAAPVVSLARLIAAKEKRDPNAPLIDPAGNVQRVGAVHDKPLVLFMVVGETARAANFQLGGYSRATNPELSGR